MTWDEAETDQALAVLHSSAAGDKVRRRLATALLVLCTAVAVLSGGVFVMGLAGRSIILASNEDRERADCDAAFTALIADAAQQVRSTGEVVNRLESWALMTLADPDELARLSPEDRERVRVDVLAAVEALKASEEATAVDAAAVAARAAWYDAGQPLPCPIPPASTADS